MGSCSSVPIRLAQLRHRLETYVFPQLGRYPIKTIVAADLLRVLRRIEANGTHETAHRVRSVCSRVFRYAVVCQKADRDPALPRRLLAPCGRARYPSGAVHCHRVRSRSSGAGSPRRPSKSHTADLPLSLCCGLYRHGQYGRRREFSLRAAAIRQPNANFCSWPVAAVGVGRLRVSRIAEAAVP